MHLGGITVHPLKSARGVALDAVDLVPGGLPHDRSFLIVDRTGRFVTQRERPELARIVATLDLEGGSLRLTNTLVPDSLTVDLAAAPDARGGHAPTHVHVWKREVPCDDAGDEAARWLSHLLGDGHRLVRVRDEAASRDATTSFADDAPILATTGASLHELSTQAGTPLTMERFRPNLVVEGGRPYEEDFWDRVQIGEVTFRALHGCGRCVLTTVDPDTLERGPEPLRTLAHTRRRGSDVIFGRYLVAVTAGRIAVGDAVTVERWRDTPAPA